VHVLVGRCRRNRELSEEDFSSWRRLLEDRTGIHLVPQQKAFLQSQLTIRTRELGQYQL
jgi:type IV pilus assembly protein PilK